MTQPVPAAPYGEPVTDTITPVTVTTYRLIEKLFQSKQDGDVAHVTFTDLRQLVLAGQRALLEDLERRTSHCHVCGADNPPSETYVRFDGVTFCLGDHRK